MPTPADELQTAFVNVRRESDFWDAMRRGEPVTIGVVPVTDSVGAAENPETFNTVVEFTLASWDRNTGSAVVRGTYIDGVNVVGATQWRVRLE